MDAPPPEMRIGDQERRAVDARLQAAHADGMLTLSEYDERAKQVWAARTHADLAVLTQDLPAPPPSAGAAAVPAAYARPVRSPLKRLASGVGGVAAAGVLVFAGVNVANAADGAAVFGDRTITVTDQQRVQVGMMFGDVEIVVPDDVRVRSGGTVLFGDLDCAQACGPRAPGAREVVVDASGAFGDVKVLTQTEKATQPANSGRNRGHNDD